jgi:hypothetical protein
MPSFRINEVRNVASKPRGEFIELLMLSDGNLAALRLFAAVNSTDEPLYDFPSCEVKSGDYVLLHLRQYDKHNAVDELDDALNLSGPNSNVTMTDTERKNINTDCPADVRDLWLGTNKEVLRKTDIIYFLDQDDKILDALPFCAEEKESEKWEKSDALKDCFAYLQSEGAWIGERVDSSTTTAARTICRKNGAAGNEQTAASWYAEVKTSNVSPGKENK